MKDVKGFEGRYAITEDGKVWSHKNNKFLKPKTVRGYHMVDLFRGGSKTKVPVSIHRLVAMAYIPNPNNLPCVNHKDETRTNNNVENLEWCSYSYNNTYGQRIQKVSEKNKAHATWKRAVEKRKKAVQCVETGIAYESAASAARILDICPSPSVIAVAARG